jgi:DNA-binding response OmpR family regulator
MKHRHSILVAEDEHPMASALEAKLSTSGFSVTVVHDGDSALKQMTASKFDLVLLDLMMPKKSGLEVLHELQSTANSTPVFVLSSVDLEADRERAREAGAHDYIIKSNTSLAEIIQRVSAFFDTPKAHPHTRS